MRTYRDADGYDLYMGGWSSQLSPQFLAFTALEAPEAVLDVGCGTGNLLVAAAGCWPRARLAGVDPSDVLLEKARGRGELNSATFATGIAERLPFADQTFDATLSMLVLQEFPDRLAALAEMQRITRRGGSVAACQWDFARMPVIHTLIESIGAVDSAIGEAINGDSPRVFTDEADLALWWEKAGLADVTTARMSVTRSFGCFDDIWRPLLRGATPSTLALASLSPVQQAAVRELMRSGLGDDGGTLRITAEALVVRGRA